VNRALRDIFDDPKALLDATFDPRHYSFLGVALGDSPTSFSGWEIAEANEFGWHFLDGGVRFRVRDSTIVEIGLPGTYLHRLGIFSTRDLLLCFGEPDDTSDILFGGRVSVRAYIWYRGFAVWCSGIDGACGHLVFYDPTKPSPRHEPEHG
jgi:hypothetical protein